MILSLKTPTKKGYNFTAEETIIISKKAEEIFVEIFFIII